MNRNKRFFRDYIEDQIREQKIQALNPKNNAENPTFKN